MEGMRREVLYDRSEIAARVKELAREISGDYQGRELIVIGVLKGAFIFMADLIRALSIPCRIDFIKVASYGAEQESSGRIKMTKDIETDLAGRDVLIVEDIVDSGLTLSWLVDYLKKKNPCSLRVCAFLDKSRRRKVPFTADYTGFKMDDGFVVGYGLDYDEQARYLPDVYIIK